MKQVTIENVKARIAELEWVDQIIGLGLHAEFEMACLRQLVELEAKCAALAAENAGLRDYRPQPSGAAMMEALDAFYEHDDVPEQGMMAAFEILCCKRPKTPATDSFLAEVRAQGVEMFGQYHNFSEKLFIQKEAKKFAAQLRKGVQS